MDKDCGDDRGGRGAEHAGHLVAEGYPRVAQPCREELRDESPNDAVEYAFGEQEEAHGEPNQRRTPSVDEPEEGIRQQEHARSTADRYRPLADTIGDACEDQYPRHHRRAGEHEPCKGYTP